MALLREDPLGVRFGCVRSLSWRCSMRRFLPFVFALVFTAVAMGLTLIVVRPGIRHKLADVIEEITEETDEGEDHR
jgi:hypothetical protein